MLPIGEGTRGARDNWDYGYDVTVLGRLSGCNRRGRRVGRRGLLWSDRPVRQADAAGCCRAAGTSSADGAGPAGTGDPGSSELAGGAPPLRSAGAIPT